MPGVVVDSDLSVILTGNFDVWRPGCFAGSSQNLSDLLSRAREVRDSEKPARAATGKFWPDWPITSESGTVTTDDECCWLQVASGALPSQQ